MKEQTSGDNSALAGNTAAKPARFLITGVTQKDRDTEFLRPDYFKPDERTSGELLKNTIELARTFNYFTADTDTEANGNWESFFLMDPAVLAKFVIALDPGSLIQKFERASLNVEQLIRIGQPPAQEKVQEYLEELNSIVQTLERDFLNLGTYFTNLVYHTDRSGWDDQNNLRARYEALFSASQSDHMSDVTDDAKSNSDRINALRVRFDDTLVKGGVLVKDCQQYVRSLEVSGSYHPHTGLFIVFLELFRSLQNALNDVTRRHLDFYYRSELNILSQSAVPDKLFLCVTLNPTLAEFKLGEKELLQTELPGSSRRIQYSTDYAVVLHHAEVTALKTVYISSREKFAVDKASNTTTVTAQKIFQADNPVVRPADFLEKNKSIRSWPVLGEDQTGLEEDKQSMKDAGVGWQIASPLFYAVDGRRRYEIRFYINPEYYERFAEYAEDYKEAEYLSKLRRNKNPEDSGASLLNKDDVMYEMLKNAFLLRMTVPGKWAGITRCKAYLEKETVKTGDEMGMHYISIQFELDPSDTAFANYDSSVHGGNFDVNWPVLSILLNNDTFCHPYSFLKEITINRITVNLKVNGSRHLRLKNNIGLLSMSSPFQAFGPQPEPGSFLDICNSNVFNKYTRDFSIKLNWFDLPKRPGGFESYYEAYDAAIKNQSFQVAVNPCLKGHVIKENAAAGEDEETLQLFTAEDGLLRSSSLLHHKNFANCHFENEMLLDREYAATVNPFSEGVLRMELTKPDNGFGHKLYPVVFPKAMLYNSRGFMGGMFRKKLPIPPPPISPRLLDLEVNYELEYSTLISERKSSVNKQEPLRMWHIHPFGNHQVIPGKIGNGITLIPYFEFKANLFIGLKNISPGKVLNLFFQMDEHNFFTVEDEREPLHWSYLRENTWKPFDRDSILEDGTSKFINTGIIKLVVPTDISAGNSILNPSYCWIRVSSKAYICTRVKAVFTQVIAATRNYNDITSDGPGITMPPGSVKDFVRKIPQIISVVQPFNSFDGMLAETDTEYYTRVSELLRHKQRFLTEEDIAQSVLEKFSTEIYKVICYNARAPQYNYRPGKPVQVVLIPKVSRENVLKIQEPKVKISTIYKVRKFLEDRVSPLAGKNQLEVRNPDYETVKVLCSVLFKTKNGSDTVGALIEQLNRELKEIISLWAPGNDTSINTDGLIYPAEILNFIKSRHYVLFVTGFTLFHFYTCYNSTTQKNESRVVDSTAEKVPFLKVFLPGAIFVSADVHTVSALRLTENEKVPPSRPAQHPSINNLMIGKEFIVDKLRDKIEYIPPEEDADPEQEMINIYLNSK